MTIRDLFTLVEDGKITNLDTELVIKDESGITNFVDSWELFEYGLDTTLEVERMWNKNWGKGSSMIVLSISN
jgi:hypothetical protein